MTSGNKDDPKSDSGRGETRGASVEAGFLDAIRRAPGDRATHVVYADWLEENGFIARATFLRLEQAQLERETRWRRDHPAGRLDLKAARFVARIRSAAAPSDAAWRALVTRAPITACGANRKVSPPAVEIRGPCPERWDALKATHDPSTRFCESCARNVYFCKTMDEVEAHGRRNDSVTFDPSLDEDEGCRAYQLGAGHDAVE